MHSGRVGHIQDGPGFAGLGGDGGFSAGTAVGQTTPRQGADTFEDVPAGHWADQAIGWAVADEIT